MPGGDRTGPAGLGPMTGRGAGYCAGYAVPGYANMNFGRGYGFWGCGRGCGGNFGGGRGWRNMYWQTGQPGWMRSGGIPATGVTPPFEADPGQEKEYWQKRKEFLEKQMQQAEQHLAEMSEK